MDIERDKGTVEANGKALTELTCGDCWYCTWSDLWTSACIKFELPIKADGQACISIVQKKQSTWESGNVQRNNNL